jgi:hypothetical protein
MQSEWIFYGRTAVELLLLIATLIVVLSWRRSRGKPFLIVALSLQAVQPFLWWVWQQKIQSGTWPWLGTMSHLFEGMSLLASWGVAAFLLLFALSARAELAKSSTPPPPSTTRSE